MINILTLTLTFYDRALLFDHDFFAVSSFLLSISLFQDDPLSQSRCFLIFMIKITAPFNIFRAPTFLFS